MYEQQRYLCSIECFNSRQSRVNFNMKYEAINFIKLICSGSNVAGYGVKTRAVHILAYR